MRGKEALFETFQAMIIQKPFSSIAVKELVKEANVNRNTFYYHFIDMESFLKDYLDDHVFTKLQRKIIENDFSLGFDMMLEKINEKKEVFHALLSDSESAKIIEDILHTNIRMDIQRVLYDYEHKLKIRVSEQFLNFFAHQIANEYQQGIKALVLDGISIDILKTLFKLYADSIQFKLVKVSKI